MSRFSSARGGPGVVALTMHEDDESVFAALWAGALGYLDHVSGALLKLHVPDRTEAAIRARDARITRPGAGDAGRREPTTGNRG